MISDTAASFIVLQKQFANIVWVFLPTIILLKLLLTSITIEGGQGVLSLLKGCFYSIMILIIFNYFYPSFIGVVDKYLEFEPMVFKSKSGWDSFWNFASKYTIGGIAVLFHALSSIILMIFLAIVTVSFSISYALYAIFGFDGPWKITVKCTLAVILWTGAMYFMKSDVSVAKGVSEESAAAYFMNAAGSAFISGASSFLAFKYESIVNKAKEISDNYSKKNEYEAQRQKAEEDIRKGNVDVDENTGQMVMKNDYRDPSGDALRAHQSKMINENPHEAKKHGLKRSNWRKFEEEVNSKNNFEPQNYNSLNQFNEGFKESLNESNTPKHKPETVSLPKGLNPYKMNSNNQKVDYAPIKNSKKETTGFDVSAADEKSFEVEGSKFIKNKEGNYYCPGESQKLSGISELKVNGKTYQKNPKSKHNYFNLIDEEMNTQGNNQKNKGVSQ